MCEYSLWTVSQTPPCDLGQVLLLGLAFPFCAIRALPGLPWSFLCPGGGASMTLEFSSCSLSPSVLCSHLDHSARADLPYGAETQPWPVCSKDGSCLASVLLPGLLTTLPASSTLGNLRKTGRLGWMLVTHTGSQYILAVQERGSITAYSASSCLRKTWRLMKEGTGIGDRVEEDSNAGVTVLRAGEVGESV